MQDKTKMDFPCLQDVISKSSWIFNQPNNTDDNGWKKLCSTDCNGTIQNIGDPSNTCGCYLKTYSSNRHHEGKRNKGQNKKSKEYPIHPSSAFENILLKANNIKLNTVFERTNTRLSKENVVLKEKNNKFVNSELSYFSDRNFDDLKSFEDLGFPKVVKHDSEDSNPKRFTLFPEKSSSSPSILDGLSSYLKKNTPPRPRSLSDPQSKQQIPSPEKFKDDSPDSGFNYQNRSPGFKCQDISPGFNFQDRSPGFNCQDRSPGFNSQDRSPDIVASQILALRSKIDELESEFRVKDETINENTELPDIFNDKNCHGSIEQTPIQQEKTMNESFSSLYGLIPKRLFDCYSLQNQKVITAAENTYVYRRKENYLCHQKANRTNSLDVGINKPKFIVPHNNSSDFYPFPPNMYHSLNYPPMNRQPLYCNIDSAGLSREWISFLKKFQSLSTGKMYGTDNSASEMKGQGKKNYKKANLNQQQQSQPAMECKFCKSNMESPKMVKSHNLKQRVGRRTLVTCPVLRKLVCERCGETGDNAHTLSYCPRVIAESGKKPVSVAAELKKTRRVASGKMRKPF